MSDDSTSGRLHLTVDADVRVTNPARLGGASGAQIADALAELIRRHAWEAGLEVLDPKSVRVVATPLS
jgi:hypothetical protein